MDSTSKLKDFCLNTACGGTNGANAAPGRDHCARFGRTDDGYHLLSMVYVSYLGSNAATRLPAPRGVSAAGVECDAEGIFFLDCGTDRRGVAAGRRASFSSTRAAPMHCSSAGRWGFRKAPGELTSAWTAFSRHERRRLQQPLPSRKFARTGVGWTALHPNRVATGVVHAYSADLLSDVAAVELGGTVSGIKLADVAFRPVNPYVRARVWEGNCVAIGGSACSLDPIHNVDLHALQLGIVHLLALFPVSGQFGAEREEYNRIIHSHDERIRDFQCAFYALAPFSGDFWRQAREQPVPQTVAHKIALFRARGEVAPMEERERSFRTAGRRCSWALA